MNDRTFLLRRSRRITADVVELLLEGDTSDLSRPGQFVNIALPGFFLRRPVSVADWRDGELRLLVRLVGAGTRALADATPGTRLDLLSGLGNGFDASLAGSSRPVLVGGGIGVAPLLGLARRMAGTGSAPDVALGFRNRADALCADEFRSLGCRVAVATEDGSLGHRGFVTEPLRPLAASGAYVFACGPLPMLRAVHALPGLSGGQYSLEARMGCGFGACVGCTIETRGGPRRVCREGPVFLQEELPW